MTLKHYQIFLVVAEELHFGRAAEKLSIAQPALSAQIKALEYDLGVALFQRTTRRVRLTAAGEAFLPEAIATLAQADAARRTARAAGATGKDTVKIGGVDSATAGLLPRIIREYLKDYPEVSLKVFEMLSAPGLGMLDSRALDIAFVRTVPTQPHFDSRHVLSEQVILALPAFHPLAAEVTIDAADLADAPLITDARSSRPILFDVIHGYLRSHGVDPTIRQEASERHMATAMVASGLGVSLVPAWVSDFQRDDVVFRPFADGGPIVDVHAVWRADEQMQSVLDFVDRLVPVSDP